MFTGSIVALATPMTRAGDLDEAALARLVEAHLRDGTHGIVPVGTTGESPTVTMEQNMRIIERVIELVDGRIPVIAGTGANATAEALELTESACRAGADGALLVTPYYNKPSQEGLYRHFATIADRVALPQVLYNVPGRTGCDLLPATIARLAPLANVVGIKDACGDATRVDEIRRRCDEAFVVLSGEDSCNYTMMHAGARGCISVTANVVPALMRRFCEAMLAGDETLGAELHERMTPLHRGLFVESNPIPVKWALYEMGLIDDGIRLPLTPLAEEFRGPLREVLRDFGLLSAERVGESVA